MIPDVASELASRVVGVLIALVVAGCGAATPSETPPYPTAAAACQAHASGWPVDVEVDHADSSALALVSAGSIALCLAYRDGSGFGTTSVGIGGHPAPSPVVLSYLTSQTAGHEVILVGRFPPGAEAVRLTLADGSTHDASLGKGLWLAWLSTDSEPTLIEALDASGTTLDRLADPNPIEPT